MSEQVRIAEAKIDRAPAVLKAYGLGSCLAVGLYDPETGLGGLGPMLLPDRPDDSPSGSESKYVDAGIRRIVDQLMQAGANRSTLVAKLSGGANMFETSYQTLINSVGARNAKSARHTLGQLSIPIVAQEVGGNRGRTVEFDLATGKMLVYCAHTAEPLSL